MARNFTTRKGLQLWELNITQIDGKIIEAKGREEVNKLLQEDWIILHIYTLKYQENGEWFERPMAILGKLEK